MTRRTIAPWISCGFLFAAASLAAAEGVSIGGRVVLPGGGPLAEAEVQLRPLRPALVEVRARLAGETAEPAARTRTAADGRYRIEAPHAGLWTVRVEAPGFVPLELDLQPLIEPQELPDAEMSNDSGLTVTVIDPQAAPLAGALVLVRTERARLAFLDAAGWRAPLRSGQTAADGKLLLPRGAAERVSVSVSHPRFVHAERHGLAGTAARFTLAAGLLRGIEVRAAAGEPLAGVMLAAGERAHPLGATDDHGRLTLVLDRSRPVAVELLAADGRRLKTRLDPSALEDGVPQKLVLPDRLAVSGRLIDADSRRAIAGGLVWDAENPVEGFVTDEGGGFVLRGPLGSHLTVTAGAPGYLGDQPVDYPLTGDGRPGPTLALRAAAVIEGQVVDGDGNPVAGARVDLEIKRASTGRMRIEIGRPKPAPRALSGPPGTFRLSPVDPEESYVVKVQAAGFAPGEAPVAGLAPHRTKSGLRIELDRGRSVSGAVIDAAGLPLRDVALTLKPQEAGGGMGMMRFAAPEAVPFELGGTTDGAGKFAVHGLPARKFDLEAWRPGFAKRTVSGVDVSGREPSLDLGKITLEPGQRVQGVVTDSGGLPLEGVRVSASAGGSTMTLMQGPLAAEPEPDAVTDPRGWFAVDDLAASESYSFHFERTGFVGTSAKSVALPRLEPLEIKMDAASDVSGSVTDSAGEPLAGARVNLERSKTIEMGGAVMQTVMMTSETSDAEGRFLFADQEPGTISLSAVASGYQEAKRDNVEIPRGEDVTGQKLPLARGAILEGRVLTPDGRPAIGASVRRVTEGSGMVDFGGQPTDGNGYYRLLGLEPGPVSIEATHDEYPRVVRDIELDEGIQALDLHLTGGFEVAGRVSATDGSPVVDALVALAPAGRRFGGPETKSGIDGTFSIPGVQEGEYMLWVEASGYAPSPGIQRVTVEGEPLYGLEVALDAGGAVFGKVRGLAPEKLGRVSVRAQAAEFGAFNSSTLDSQGDYRIEHLRPGAYEIVAQLADSGREAKESVVLDAGVESLEADLKFDSGLTLRGRAVQAGAPVVGATVMVEGVDVARSGWGQTGEQGGFSVDGLAPGRFRIKLRDWESGLSHDETLDLATSREVLLEVPSGSVAGVLADAADRQALAGVALTLEPVNELLPGRLPPHAATTDLDGRFRISSVADGEWRLSAVKQGYAATSRAVTVKNERGVDDLRIPMEATEGMTLETHLPSGGAPDEIRVAVLDPAGAALVSGVFQTGENGRVRLSTVPAGTWDVVVSAAGSATANLRAGAPGAAVPVALEPATGLKISVPELQRSDLVATVRVRDAAGALFRTLEWSGRPVTEWRMFGGTLEFAALPPGSWAVTVAAADGRTWEGRSETAGGTTSQLVLE